MTTEVQVLTEIPCGAESGWHIHPGEEVGYILAGTVQMMIQGQPTLTLDVGDPFLMPPRTPHNALDIGPGTTGAATAGPASPHPGTTWTATPTTSPP